MDDLLQPMLASLTDAPLADPHLVYEPKYDGIRAIAEIAPVPSEARKGTRVEGRVRLWSRLGNEKTKQFPEIAAALATWARNRKEPLVLDGEIVALDAKGEPTGFQNLQGRIHLHDGSGPSSPSRPSVAFIAFDLLRDGKTDYRGRPLHERRTALERLLGSDLEFVRSTTPKRKKSRSDPTAVPVLRLSQQVRGDGRALYKEARKRGW